MSNRRQVSHSKYHRLSLARVKRILAKIPSFILLALGAIFMFAPFVWMFSTSLQPGSEAFKVPPKWIPTEWMFSNYHTVIFEKEVPFILFGWNSLKVAGLVTIGQLITCSLAGFAFARLRFPGKNWIFVVLLSGLMVPVQVMIIPIYVIMRTLGLIDTHWALILPWITNIFGVFLLRQFFLTLPKDLIDAARIDGANYWQIYAKIALPLAKPSLAALAVVTFTNTWNNYFLPLVFISSKENMTLPLGIRSLFNVYGGGNIALVMAGVSVAVLPVLIIFLLAQKRIIEGMLRGSIKG
ncbi:MAG: carbohydrate ABC transporter permease [Anaerolineae bacterium]|nr:carbohydrate ABC transporter permease [Anaerolineae bacterium]